MKKLTVLLTVLVLILSLCACGNTPVQSQDASATDEIIVFAASSMTSALTEIAEMYKEEHPDAKITFNFDSSGTLKTQIQEGAACDIFISASQKAMDELDIQADPAVNTEGLDFVEADTRFDFVSNLCVLVVTEGNPKGISSFEDVATDNVALIALGNDDVPAGQYAREIFVHLGLWDSIQNKITFASNAKEVTAWVGEGAADCGVCYATDAYDEGLEYVAQAEADWHTPVVYPAAVLKTAQNPDDANEFIAYLQTDAVSAYLESVGFSLPS